ncbi:hypothetical protein ONE63_000199 [Megalurothrips usitatus]|uniref:Uncharacterized protein n=1 Tax=Megalurothrips usitatus TaxID=439358 RepID=A0AAV7XXQ2_9NEOP|nr:hypothetical protein ONE63_000199 [Megalurothrips usitatus]
MLPRACLALCCVLVVAVLGSSAAAEQRQHHQIGSATNGSVRADRTLTRRKRYIVFPRGSSIQLVYCMSFRGYIPFQTMFVFGLTAGLAWQLPTDSQQIYLQRRDVGAHPDRQHRLSLFRSVQAFLTQRGLYGEECVQRTLCESSSRKPGGGTFMEEVLKVLFSLPESDGGNTTPWDSARYNGTPCDKRFPRCSSVLDISMPIGVNK